MAIRGTVSYRGGRDEYEGYWQLAIAIIRRAHLDAQMQPDRYKSAWVRREVAQARAGAIEFLLWAQALGEGDARDG